MKIVDVRSAIAAIPRRRPLVTSYGDSPHTVTAVVQAFTDEGITGIGQKVGPASDCGDSAESVEANIDEYPRSAVVGEDPFDIERLFVVMHRALRGTYYPMTAVEYALWEIKGKALDVPVYQLLGGRCQPGTPLHAVICRILWSEPGRSRPD